MEETNIFEKFAKGGNDLITQIGNNCVIYTRVSTKEQAENNLSLETQRKACEQLAKKQAYNILAYFGGTYESAKTDERNEFKNMLSFVKKSREKISFIIVYSVDRFSRSGANAIYIASELKKQGVAVLSVTQPTDSHTASGSLQQNIQFIFSEYDNQMRREKCMAGVKEKLMQGYWVTKAPLGYDHIRRNGERFIEVNETGKLLNKAFKWKANEGISNEEIRHRLSAQGLKLGKQRISEIFKNPFYCGMIVHNLLEGKTVEGKHEKLISQEIFLKVNNLLSLNHNGYKQQPENDQIPLKRFVMCESCRTFLRGYEVKARKIHYYKCNTLGCGCNKSAKDLHQSFYEKLKQYTFQEEHKDLFKYQLEATFKQLNESKESDITQLQKQLEEVNQKIERLKERFVTEEIDKELYQQFIAKYKQEKEGIEQQFQKTEIRVSNISEYVNTSLNIALKLPEIWASVNYEAKHKLQYLVFPEGMYYNKKNNECRTPKTNSVFSLISCLSNNLMQKNSGLNSYFGRKSALVAGARLELTTFGL